jgi:hypothetical protein
MKVWQYATAWVLVAATEVVVLAAAAEVVVLVAATGGRGEVALLTPASLEHPAAAVATAHNVPTASLLTWLDMG